MLSFARLHALLWGNLDKEFQASFNFCPPFCFVNHFQFPRFALSFTCLVWFGINWHVLNQSKCRNCCLYIINAKTRQKYRTSTSCCRNNDTSQRVNYLFPFVFVAESFKRNIKHALRVSVEFSCKSTSFYCYDSVTNVVNWLATLLTIYSMIHSELPYSVRL